MYLDGGVRAFPTGLSLSELRYGCIPHDGDFGLHRNEKKNAHGSDTHTHTHTSIKEDESEKFPCIHLLFHHWQVQFTAHSIEIQLWRRTIFMQRNLTRNLIRVLNCEWDCKINFLGECVQEVRHLVNVSTGDIPPDSCFNSQRVDRVWTK